MSRFVFALAALLGFLWLTETSAIAQRADDKKKTETPAKPGGGGAAPPANKKAGSKPADNGGSAKKPVAKPGGAKDPDTKPAAKSPARRFQKVIVRFSYIPGPQALPTIIARERGFFRREGLIVSALPVTRQQAIVDSLRAGITDFATGSQAWLLDVAQAKVPMKVVAMNGHGRAMELIVPAWDKRTKKMADFRGKTILLLRGTHNFDAIAEFFKILLFNRMKLGDVRFSFVTLPQLRTFLSKSKKVQAALRRQRIGGFLGYREHTNFYVENKSARVVLSNQQISKLLGRNGPRPLFASAAIVKDHPETVQRFVNAWVAALDYLNRNEDQAVRLLRVYLARQFGRTLSKERARFYVHSIKYARFKWTAQDITETNINGKIIRAGRNLLWGRIKDPKKRPFQTAPVVDGYIDNRFVEKALKKLKQDRERAAARSTKEGNEKKADSPKKAPAGEEKKSK